MIKSIQNCSKFNRNHDIIYSSKHSAAYWKTKTYMWLSWRELAKTKQKASMQTGLTLATTQKLQYEQQGNSILACDSFFWSFFQVSSGENRATSSLSFFSSESSFPIKVNRFCGPKFLPHEHNAC